MIMYLCPNDADSWNTTYLAQVRLTFGIKPVQPLNTGFAILIAAAFLIKHIIPPTIALEFVNVFRRLLI